MVLGKQRSENQISEDKSIRVFLRSLPSEWIWRMLTPDYGVDFEIEFVEPNAEIDLNGNKVNIDISTHIVTGDIIWVQLKSTNVVKEKGDFIKFKVDKSLLWYSAGCNIPIILALVELSTEKIYWIHLQQYLRDSHAKNDYTWWMNESNTTIYIDKETCIIDSQSEAFTKWKYISNEVSVIKQLAIFQGTLSKCLKILDDLVEVEDKAIRKKLVSDLSENFSGCWCLGVLFHDSYYRDSIRIRNDILDPLIDSLDSSLDNNLVDFNYSMYRTKIYELLDFSYNWISEFNIQ